MQLLTLLIATFLVLAGTSSAICGVTGRKGYAKLTHNNPKHPEYAAIFNGHKSTNTAINFLSNVQGQIKFRGTGEINSNSTSIKISIDLHGILKASGPYAYYILTSRAPADGSCDYLLLPSADCPVVINDPRCFLYPQALDPYERTRYPQCDATSPGTCMVGDLSGKHGWIPSNITGFRTSYIEFYASTIIDSLSYIGNGSVAIQDLKPEANGRLARLAQIVACANITAQLI